MPAALIDSHTHLTDTRLAADAAPAMERARTAGVDRVVTIGTDLADSRAAVALAAMLPGLFAGVGLHPHKADRGDDDVYAELVALAREPDVVAIGETGLDYHYDHAPRGAQRAAFLRHLELGRELGMPVIVHTRDADADTAAILLEAGQDASGVLHCFTGGRELMETALELGWYVSFAGMITFPKYADAELVRAVPADRILVETDAPYVAPVPFRGKRNEPAYVTHTARRAAELRGETFETFAAAVTRNAERLYGLDVADAL